MGNVERTHQYDEVKRVMVFAELKKERNQPPYGSLQRAKKRLREDHGYEVPTARLKKMRREYNKDNWVYSPAKKRGGRPLILSEEGEERLVTKLKGHTARSTAKKYKFSTPEEEDSATVSRQTVMRTAKRRGLVIAEPKIIRISKYTDHHKKMRMLHCKWIISLTTAQLNGLWYSDEMSFPITLTPNKKNDVMYCEAGEQKNTNRHRITKGSTGKMCSLWWVINRNGVQALSIYDEMMGVKLFHDILKEDLRPAIEEQKRGRNKLRYFYHDHVTNSGALYDVKKMNATCGEGKWLPFSPNGCREQDGFIEVSAFDNGRRKIKAYKRKNMVAKKNCDCNADGSLTGQFVPAAAPDLNLIEYLNGYLRQVLWEACQEGEEEWRGSPKKKKMVIRRMINKVNKKASFFRSLYENHVERCKKIIEVDGEVLP